MCSRRRSYRVHLRLVGSSLLAVVFGVLLATSGCGTQPATVVEPNSDPVTSDQGADGGDIIDPADTSVSDKRVALSADPGFCCDPLSINFTAVLEGDDASSGGVRFFWDFGDGRTGEGESVQHTYQWAGVYPVTVTVRFSDGSEILQESTLTLEVADGQTGVVLEPVDSNTDNTGLVVEAGLDQEVFAGEVVTLSGRVERYPRSGSAPTSLWRQLKGPGVALTEPTSVSSTFVAPEAVDSPLTLKFELAAKEGDLRGSDTVQIVVLPSPDDTNHQPSAAGTRVASAVDTPVTITLSGSDPDGDELTFELVDEPAHGSLASVGYIGVREARFLYTPDPGFIGTDQFVYVADDGEATSAEATVWIDIGALNRPPTLANHHASTTVNRPVDLTVTASDPDGDELLFAVSRPPMHGTITSVTPSGGDGAVIRYVPGMDFVGTDWFVFHAYDGAAESAPATFLIAVLASDGGPSALDVAYVVPRNSAVRVTMSAEQTEGPNTAFLVSDPPAHGTLGAVVNEGLDSASVVYTPDAGFEGTDSFKFRVRDGEVESAEASVSLRVMKLLVPWLEVNSPRSSADSIYTEEEGALPGMTRLDYCLAGLEYWAQVTDLVIVTTAPGQAQYLYPELMRRKPAHLRIVGGVKTFSLPGARPSDDRPYDFADAEGWQAITDEVLTIAQLTGMDQVVLENETSLTPFHFEDQDIDFERLGESLKPLEATGIETWWAPPSVLMNTDAVPDQQSQTSQLVETVVNAVPNSMYLVTYSAWQDRLEDRRFIELRALMEAIVGADRMQDGLYVNLDGYISYPELDKRCYTPEEAIAVSARLPGDMLRIYPGGRYWINVARRFAEELPPLARTATVP